MSHSLKIIPLVVAVAGTTFAWSAHAQEEDADRFTLRLGAMQAEAESQFKGTVDFAGDTYRYTGDRLDLGDETVPRVEGIFRFFDRHRLLFNYFKYDKDKRHTLGEDVALGDVSIPAGSFAKTKTEFDLASLVYDYSVIETPTTSLGLQIGAEWARLKARVYAETADGINSYEGRESESGYAPVVGLRFSANTVDRKWGFTVQGQYLDADWGDFKDYSGDITRANALVEYRFTPHFGLYAGYDWFKLDVNRHYGDGTVGLDQRFKGPIAGVTLAF